MSVHLQREIERVKKSILALCAIVEDQVQAAVRALLERDVELAHNVEQRDRDIDQREVEVEEECLKILALHQPVAIDLRFIVAAMKINNDLERIGDLAVNIARKAVSFAAEPPMAIALDIAGMWEKTHAMLRDSLDALVNMDGAWRPTSAAATTRWTRSSTRFARGRKSRFAASPSGSGR